MAAVVRVAATTLHPQSDSDDNGSNDATDLFSARDVALFPDGSESDALVPQGDDALVAKPTGRLMAQARRMWAAATLVGVALLAALATVVPLAWVELGASTQARSHRKQDTQDDTLETKAEIFQGHCFMTETDIDYDPLGVSNMSLDHIPFPEMCCAMCHGIPSCAAWVWKEDKKLEGCRYKCWVLHEIPPFRPPVKMYEKLNIVSGIPPPRPRLAPIPQGTGRGEPCPGGQLEQVSNMEEKGKNQEKPPQEFRTESHAWEQTKTQPVQNKHPKTAVNTQPTVENKQPKTVVNTQPLVENKQPKTAVSAQPTVENRQPKTAVSTQPTVENGLPKTTVTTHPTVENRQPKTAVNAQPTVESKQPKAAINKQPIVENSQTEKEGTEANVHSVKKRELAFSNESSVSLFCFSLVLPYGYELKFLAMQFSLKTSIFACDQYAVYTNKSIEIAPQVKTQLVDSDLSCGRGGDSYTALNSWIFIAVWRAIIKDGCFKEHDWTVKVDADAIFLPDRLRIVLQDYKDFSGYLNNCQYGMHGPIEVLTRAAIETLAVDYTRSENGTRPEKCVHELPFGLWGEDMFLDQCLSKVLGIESQLDVRLLCESNCNCPDWFWCKNGTERVSYHPFKREDMYRQCMANAMDAGLPIP